MNDDKNVDIGSGSTYGTDCLVTDGGKHQGIHDTGQHREENLEKKREEQLMII